MNFYTNLLNLSKPYRLRLVLGVVFGILVGLGSPLLIGTIRFVTNVVLKTVKARYIRSSAW